MAVTKIRGTQIMVDTIPNEQLEAGLSYIRTNVAEKMTVDFDINSNRIKNVPDAPAAGSDAVNKNYVDAVASGLEIKKAVRAASLANISAIGIANKIASIVADDVTLVAGDRVLLMAQTNKVENGIYDVKTDGTDLYLQRSADADGTPASEVVSGMFCFVTEGTAYDNMGMVLATNNPISVGTTELVFTPFSGAGQIDAGAGLTKEGNRLDVGAGNGIAVTSDAIAANIDTKSALTFGISGESLGKIQVVVDTLSALKINETLGLQVAVNAEANNALKIDAVSNDLQVLVDPAKALKIDGNNGIQLLLDSATVGLHNAAKIDATNGLSVPVDYAKALVIDAVNGLQLVVDPIVNNAAKISETLGLEVLVDVTSNNNALILNGSKELQVPVKANSGIYIDGVNGLALNMGDFVSSHYSRMETPVGLVDGANTAFTPASTMVAGSETVFLNGIALDSGDYSVAANVITLAPAPIAGDKIRVSYFVA